MALSASPRALTPRLIDTLHVEAMVLADEARAYFDRRGASQAEVLTPEQRVALACESLRVTTRLMHVVAWLLTRRAEAANALDRVGPAAPERRLATAASSDPVVLSTLPAAARSLSAASQDLHARVARIDQGLEDVPVESPARRLLDRLEGTRF